MAHCSDYSTFSSESDEDRLRRLELECVSLKNYDSVTGLPHLPLFLSQAERAAQECSRRERPLGVIALSFDSLDGSGALYGLDGGTLLRAIVRRLRSCLRAEQFIARVGNKFLILLPTFDEARTSALARRFVEGRMELDLDGSRTVVAVCAGAAALESWSEDCKRDVRCVMDRAFDALHSAWQRSSGLATTHSPELGRQLRRKSAIELEFPLAAQRGQLYLLYQPIVEASTGEIVAVEALARWDHPDLGVVPPSEFIPIVERAGMSAAFDQWVFERALEDYQAMRAVANIDLHVNLTPTSLEEAGAVDARLDAIDAASIPRCDVVLELTETARAQHFDAVHQNVQRLRAEGVRVAIDDLGCGFNSLQLFARMPVDLVKIDRSFLSREDDSDALTLLRGVVDTCARLGVEAIIEGVENEPLHQLTLSSGVRYAQGYNYSVPLPASHLLALLDAGAGQRRIAKDDRS